MAGSTTTLYAIEPKEERLVVAGHAGRKLVGAAVVRLGDTDATVKLGPGGVVTGRVVDAAGAPVAGVTVRLSHERREVADVFDRTHETPVVTDAKGEFRFETVAPGEKFRFVFTKGRKVFGPDFRSAPRYQIDRHGESRAVGDIQVQAKGQE